MFSSFEYDLEKIETEHKQNLYDLSKVKVSKVEAVLPEDRHIIDIVTNDNQANTSKIKSLTTKS